MLSFPQEYFKDEIRSDFNVSEMMKRTWAAHLRILVELKVLFDKYGLTYYADFGTLLGAVRHKGIIPWDDDIDISMPRKDFMTLLEHGDEIGGGLCIRSIYSSDTFTNFHAVATHKVDTLKWDEWRMKEYFGCPFICYIDIFPMDYIPRDGEKRKFHQQLYSYSYKMVHDCVDMEEKVFDGRLITLKELKASNDENISETKLLGDFKEHIDGLEGFIDRFLDGKIRINPDKPLRNQLCRVTEHIATMFEEKDADYVDYCPHMAYSEDDLSRKKEWVKETVLLPFEVTEIAVPKFYHEVLVTRFGDGYMIPRHEPSTHDYPYFRTQVEVLIGGDTGEGVKPDTTAEPLLETVDTLIEAHEVFGSLAEQQNQALNLLADLQDGAVSVGEAVENIAGEGTSTVGKLEKYCEGIFTLYNLLPEKNHDDKEIKDKNDELKALLEAVKKSIRKEVHEAVPSGWIEKIKKKSLIYGISAADILTHGMESAEKLRASFKVFDENSDNLCVFLCLPAGFDEFLTKCGMEELLKSYTETIEEIKGKDYLIVPSESELSLAVSVCDGYYGDKCQLMEACRKAKKPVMIQDYEIKS